MHLQTRREPRDLLPKIDRLFALSAEKIRSIERTWRQVDRRRADSSFEASIVFITSVSAEMASTNRGDYCVSKAGLSMAARLFVGRVVAALVRGDLPYATGTVIHVDGGLSIPRF